MIQRRTALTSTAILISAFVISESHAYEPDAEIRKTLANQVKDELVAATPSKQQFAARVAMTGNIPFNDYERLARSNGYEPYDDCTVATFVEVTNWQIIKGQVVDAPIIAALVENCRSAERTVLGPKPLSQEIGDREILRGMWQRNLDFVAQRLNDQTLLGALNASAVERFSELHGDPDQWQLTATGFSPIAAQEFTGSSHSATTSSAQASTVPMEALILRTVTRYGLSGVYVTNATYLLLQDGSISRKPFSNPYRLNVAADKRANSDDWGRWRKTGSRLEVTWPGKEATLWEKWFVTRPASNGQRLQGQFQSADGFGGDKVSNVNTIAFEPDGRFSWASLKGGNTVWRPVYSHSTRAGRYEFDRHAIRLTYNDGSVGEYAFGFYPKDNEHFVIGNSHFVAIGK